MKQKPLELRQGREEIGFERKLVLPSVLTLLRLDFPSVRVKTYHKPSVRLWS